MESQNENKIRNYAQKLEERLFTTKLSTNANSFYILIFSHGMYKNGCL